MSVIDGIIPPSIRMIAYEWSGPPITEARGHAALIEGELAHFRCAPHAKGRKGSPITKFYEGSHGQTYAHHSVARPSRVPMATIA